MSGEERPRGDPSRARLASLLRFGSPDEADEELRFHIDMRVRDHMSRGMNEEEARMAALDRIGDVQRVRR